MEIPNTPVVNKINKKEKTITIKINTNVVTIFVLVILLGVSVTQAFELSSLRDKISAGEVKAATTSTVSTSQSSNLNDLPDMVGGC